MGFASPAFWRFYDIKQTYDDGKDVIQNANETVQNYEFRFILEGQAHLSVMTFKGFS